MSRELAVLLPDGRIIRDPGWRCIADVHRSQHGFLHNGEQAQGVIVDAVTLIQVYPPPLLMDSTSTGKTNRPLG